MADTRTQSAKAWHVFDLSAVYHELDACGSGLSEDEAKLRLERHGRNRLPERKPPSVWVVLLRHFIIR